MSPYQYEIQAIIGSDIEPTSGLSNSDKTRLTASKRVVDQNYYELDQYIDGALATNPIYICPQERRQEAGFEVLRLLLDILPALKGEDSRALGYYGLESTTWSRGKNPRGKSYR